MRLVIKNALQKYIIVNKIYSICISIAFRIITNILIKDHKKVIFSSFSGRSFNDSPKRLYELIKNDSYFKDFTLIWAFEDPNNFKNVVDKCRLS